MRALVHADQGIAMTVEEFLARSGPGEFLVLPAEAAHPGAEPVAVLGRYGLYQRRN